MLLHTMHACTNGPPNISESTASGSDSHSRTGFQTPENGATAPRPIEQVSCSRPVHAGSTRSISRFRSQPSRIPHPHGARKDAFILIRRAARGRAGGTGARAPGARAHAHDAAPALPARSAAALDSSHVRPGCGYGLYPRRITSIDCRGQLSLANCSPPVSAATVKQCMHTRRIMTHDEPRERDVCPSLTTLLYSVCLRHLHASP